MVFTCKIKSFKKKYKPIKAHSQHGACRYKRGPSWTACYRHWQRSDGTVKLCICSSLPSFPSHAETLALTQLACACSSNAATSISDTASSIARASSDLAAVIILVTPELYSSETETGSAELQHREKIRRESMRFWVAIRIVLID